MKENAELIRRKAVARMLDVHPVTLDRMVKRGAIALKPVYIGSLTMFNRVDVESLINSGSTNTNSLESE